MLVQNRVQVTDRAGEDPLTASELDRLLHDLNNHLGVIGNHAELLADDLPAGQSRDDVAAIQAAVAAAALLVARLRKIGRTAA